MNCCNKCKSKNLEVNGLFYVCKECGDINDSTFSMITESKDFKRIEDEK